MNEEFVFCCKTWKKGHRRMSQTRSMRRVTHRGNTKQQQQQQQQKRRHMRRGSGLGLALQKQRSAAPSEFPEINIHEDTDRVHGEVELVEGSVIGLASPDSKVLWTPHHLRHGSNVSQLSAGLHSPNNRGGLLTGTIRNSSAINPHEESSAASIGYITTTGVVHSPRYEGVMSALVEGSEEEVEAAFSAQQMQTAPPEPADTKQASTPDSEGSAKSMKSQKSEKSTKSTASTRRRRRRVKGNSVAVAETGRTVSLRGLHIPSGRSVGSHSEASEQHTFDDKDSLQI
uniref:Uncharacterized protein n=1 Tax=Lotharella globosa TaxID=91324 RepID=A0A7S4DQU1_9EUKA